ncbi:LolA family protein [Paenibacillus whitsoniae]|uniref:Uncharacterized protein n=1 Tax=Paenibacillus whitsoniae TaxID=2496558 RepID=A0A430JH16_9BACL|nr:hypothetical protein [Paenibacillus whitsoniae]RTE10347.1 hypothetical protein EJQ19_07560 [Paenibacillus whitsoniae]
MKMKRLIVVATLAICTIASSSVYAATQSTNHPSGLTLDTTTSRHYVFSETGTVDGVEISSQYEVWYNDKGYYRFNTISGPYTGDYEIWDGKKLYQYTKLINELTIRNISGISTPVPHLFLSPEINSRVLRDIKANKLKSVSKNEFETPNLHIKLDDDEQTVMYYSQHQDNGKPTHTIKVDKLDKKIQFDKSLLIVDESKASIQYLSE